MSRSATSSRKDKPIPRGALRATLAEITRFDRGALAPAGGLRVALGVVVALSIGLLAGDKGAAASLAVGALFVGIATVASPRRVSVAGLAAVSGAIGISVFVGSATGQSSWLHTAVLVPWCLVGGLLIALDPPAAAVGGQSIAAMIVFGRFGESIVGALVLTGYVLAGAAIASAFVILTRPPLSSTTLRAAISSAALQLAGLATGGSGRRNGIASAESLEGAERLFSTPVGDLRTRETLQALFDVLRRVRLEILALDGIERRLDRVLEGPDLPLLASAEDEIGSGANVLRGIAAVLVESRGPARDQLDVTLRDFEAAALRSTGALGDGSLSTPAPDEPNGGRAAGLREAHEVHALSGHLGALAGQLRAAADLAQRSLAPGRPLRAALRGTIERDRRGARAWLADLLERLRAHATLSSPIGRHAVRLTVVVTVAEILAQHTGLSRGYWVPLTASVVLRPDFASTFGRGAARVVGTSLGVLLAGLLTVEIHPSGMATVVAIGICCAAAAATFQASYVAFTGFLTGLVVLLVGLVTPGNVNAAVARLLDTFIGGALALTAYALWPTWSETSAPQVFSQLAGHQAEYVDAILAMTGGTAPYDRAKLSRLARAARRARAAADEVVNRSQGEPLGRRGEVARRQGTLAALSRVSLASHALAADLQEPGGPGALPGASLLGEEVSAGLRQVARRLGTERSDSGEHPLGTLLGAVGRFRSSPEEDGRALEGASAEERFPPLRRLHERLVEQWGDQPERAHLLTESDELVDAVDTVAELVGLLSEPEA
ncbi:MAG: hypothetical protein JWM85_776 [Acidimicrobiaceae bacterium]|nr:hypothetical protein [Acidimicrobiaceae bacterium]